MPWGLTAAAPLGLPEDPFAALGDVASCDLRGPTLPRLNGADLRVRSPRSRPEHDGDRPHHLRAPSTSSFPSGHASSAAFAVTLLNEGARYRWPLRIVGAVVGTSRIHVRIHHASDVIVGAGVGWLIALAWRRLWPLPA